MIIGFNYPNETRNRILSVSLTLFAKKGVNAVPLKDIAEIVGMKLSDLNSWYFTKKDLLNDIFHCFANEYNSYLEEVKSSLEEADDLDMALDVLFSKEILEVENTMLFLGMSLVIKEQHHNKNAKKCVEELFFSQAIKTISEGLLRFFELNNIHVSNINIAVMHYIIWLTAWNDIRLHDFYGEGIVFSTDINTELLFLDMRNKFKGMIMNSI